MRVGGLRALGAAVVVVGLASAVAAARTPPPVPEGPPPVVAAGAAADPATGAATVEVAVELPAPVGLGAGAAVEASPAAGLVASLAVHGVCDELDPAACLLPFPNDRFTVSDPSTPTGRRVALDLLAMPRNVLGKPVDPTEWNRNDGFSPGTPILTRVPGLDLHRTWGTDVDHVADLARYAAPDAPIVLVDVATGERHPFWSELDGHAGTTDDERLLILRPAVNLRHGARYVVALRNLRDASGVVIPAGPAFAALRDRTDPTDPRQAHHDELFAALERAGIARQDLYLAWDFTVASRENVTGRALAIRDDAFAALGDTDLADGVVEGAPPAYTITAVTDHAEGPTARTIEGTVRVPNYLTPQVVVGLPAAVGEAAAPVLDALGDVTGALPVGPEVLFEQGLAVPGSRLHDVGESGGHATVDPLQPTVDVPFVCAIARGSDTVPSDPLLYGHGLLGARQEALGGSTRALRERGFSPCAVDWWGMSTGDIATVAAILVDVSGFPMLPDRAQQGFLNFLFLGRALAHPGGLAADPAFRAADGRPLIDPAGLAFAGNSQGAIMGGSLTALAPDFERAVLGVPGMNYSTLLNRSVDWEGEYGDILYLTYPDSIDQQLLFALMQMLWDRGEADGYAHHMTADPLPGTRPHEVFLQVAFGDHQVSPLAAEVEGRTIGARLFLPSSPAGLHWSADPAFGFDVVRGDTADVGSVLVSWFADGRGLGTPPSGNVPTAAGADPHGIPRAHGPAADQAAHWLRTGDLVDTCRGPCVVPPP